MTCFKQHRALSEPQHIKNEINPLTGVRGIAAFLVMLYHMHFMPEFAGFFPVFLHRAYLSVDLFFVLSGLVLAMRYGKDFVAGVRTEKLGRFWQHRFSRIYPAFAVISAVEYVKSRVYHAGMFSAYDVAANVLLVQAWGIDATSISGNAWSISTEVFAYLLFPVLAYWIIRRCTLSVVVALVLMCLGAVTVVATSKLGKNGPLDVIDHDSFLPLMRCVAEFCLGVCAFRMAQYPLCKAILGRDISLIVVLLLMVALLWIDNTDMCFVALTVPLLLCLYYNSGASAALFGNRLAHHLGVISYSLYLVHPIFRGPASKLTSFAREHGGPANVSLYILLAVALSWAAAYMSQRFIEDPARRMLNRLH